MIPVYSISKPFLAQAVLELGIDLDSPIGEIVTGLSQPYAGRRIGALLNHTSGLDDYGPMPQYKAAVAAGERAWSRAELLSRAADLAHANHGFQYSNIGYLLLRMAVEQTTGLSYFSALNQLVFRPLGITGLAEWEEPTDAVPGYDPRWVYSGTFLAEPAAIAPAVAALVAHRKETIGLEVGLQPVPYSNTGFDHPGYSFGFMNDGNPVRAAGHGGGGPGFGLMVVANAQTGAAELEYSTAPGFDQTAAIGRLRNSLGI